MDLRWKELGQLWYNKINSRFGKGFYLSGCSFNDLLLLTYSMIWVKKLGTWFKRIRYFKKIVLDIYFRCWKSLKFWQGKHTLIDLSIDYIKRSVMFTQNWVVVYIVRLSDYNSSCLLVYWSITFPCTHCLSHTHTHTYMYTYTHK